jgi:hypothetical protein
MSGKTGDDRGPRHVCAGIGEAAACIQLAVAAWRDERGERDGGSR